MPIMKIQSPRAQKLISPPLPQPATHTAGAQPPGGAGGRLARKGGRFGGVSHQGVAGGSGGEGGKGGRGGGRGGVNLQRHMSAVAGRPGQPKSGRQ